MYDSARLGHIPSLPWESQLPLKPCISLQPLDFKGNCDYSDCFLDVCFISWYSFDLLRKCGLLAHTSAAFLKNCCTEKLFSCLRLEFSTKLQKGTANHSRCPFLLKQLQLHASLYLHVPQIFLDSTSEHRSPDNLYSGKPADQSADQK